MSAPNQPTRFWQYRESAIQAIEKPVPAEALVSLHVNGVEWLSFTCTPAAQEHLAAGFLYNEGVIQSAQEIETLHLCAAGDLVDAWLTHPAQKPARWTRTSGCAGGQTSQGLVEPLSAPGQVPARLICGAMLDLMRDQAAYRESGGLHCSALASGGAIQIMTEDIGRHNTLDKIAGALLYHPQPLASRLLLTTGRVSSEMLQKAARMQVAVIASRTSPTALSVALAEQAGIALVGYVRPDHFNIYTHPERIQIE